jgi:Photosynthetic reaction centre cytochrome C subunit
VRYASLARIAPCHLLLIAMRTVAVIAALTLAAIACARTKPGTTPAPTGAPVASAAPGSARPGEPGGPGGPGGPPRRRPPPNPLQQDTVRRAMVDSILATIAGRENQPAGSVFRNVKLLKNLTAGEFLRTMDTQYGRGLGWTCSNCHIVGKWDDDTKKNKRIARQMQAMQDYINGTQLANVKELDAEYDKTTCVMCHRGTNEPRGVMDQPTVAPPRPGN